MPQIFDRAPGGQWTARSDVRYLFVCAGQKIGRKAFANHFLTSGGNEVDSCVGHVSAGYHAV